MTLPPAQSQGLEGAKYGTQHGTPPPGRPTDGMKNSGAPIAPFVLAGGAADDEENGSQYGKQRRAMTHHNATMAWGRKLTLWN